MDVFYNLNFDMLEKTNYSALHPNLKPSRLREHMVLYGIFYPIILFIFLFPLHGGNIIPKLARYCCPLTSKVITHPIFLIPYLYGRKAKLFL